jgi:hypothetical protein
MTQINEQNVYSGSLIDIFWQKCRLHLENKVAEYFDWIEKGLPTVSPASFRRESIEQCVGAVVTYGRQVRTMAVELNARWQGSSEKLDLGQWDSVNERFIIDRGAKLTRAMGMGPKALLTEKLNHLVKDNPWFFSLLSIVSLLISLTSITIALIAFLRSG